MYVKIIGVIETYKWPTNCPGIFITHTLICPIGGHKNLCIVLLFDREDTKSHILNINKKCIHRPHFLVREVGLYIVTINIERPLLHIIDESGFIETLILNPPILVELPYTLDMDIIYKKLLVLFNKWLYYTWSSKLSLPLTTTLQLLRGSWWPILCPLSGAFIISRRDCIIRSVRSLLPSSTYHQW